MAIFVAAAGLHVLLAQTPQTPSTLPVKLGSPAVPALIETGDVRRGALIVSQGTPSGVGACARCHSFDGAADGSGAFPRLAGQDQYYLLKQLRDFTTDQRRNAVMTPFAKKLTEQQKADVAAYYAAQQAVPFPPTGLVEPNEDAVLKRGRELATVGSSALGVQACANCHGAQGTGERPFAPALQGQYAAYIEGQFNAWRRGYRRNSGGAVMHEVASKLPEADVHAVARHYEQLRLDGTDDALPAALIQIMRSADESTATPAKAP